MLESFWKVMFERLPPSKRFFTYILSFAILVIVAFLFISSGISNLTKKKYVIYFNRSVAGLNVGNQVYYKGVPVGLIHSIEIDKPKTELIKIVVKIAKDLILYEGCQAKINMQGFTGYSVLELSNTRFKKPLGGPMPEIVSVYSDVEKLFNDLPSIIKSLNNILKKNDTQLDAGLKNFNKLILGLNNAMHEFIISAQSFTKWGTNIEQNLLTPAKTSIENFAQITKTWSELSDNKKVQLVELIDNLHNISSTINDSVIARKGYMGYILGK